jgi:tRNA threonylcarbamoyladenosine biosynthesis protein TsaE
VSAPAARFPAPLVSAGATRDFAARLGRELRPGDLVLLEGELGAGKTTFVQGLARGMGLAAAVKSPTYTLVHEYRCPGRVGLGHLDLHRLAPGRDLGDLGLEDLLGRGAVAVEWGERLLASEPEALLVRLFGPVANRAPDWRAVELEARGERGQALLALAVAALAPPPPPA